MCGIIGYIGSGGACKVLANGLRRLEYRGYDSVGIALMDREDGLFLRKRPGKLIELESAINKENLSSYHIGIGHTRWATHGEPNEINAHPHTDCLGETALVHNGIIENYAVLKEALKGEGHVFVSDTDTEVLVHMIEHYHKDRPLIDSVIEALERVEGTYAIAVVSAKEPDKIVAVRKGSPLVLGISDHGIIIASDTSAIMEHTRKVVYLNDGEVVEAKDGSFNIYDIDFNHIEKHIEAIDWDIAAIEKGSFEHYMLKEIFEQQNTIHDSFRGRIIPELGNVRLDGLTLTEEEIFNIQRIIFIACGTSWHAGLIGEYLIEEYARIPVEVEYASEFRYRKPVLRKGDLVITISQSGETADTLAALREAKARGIKIMGITNVVGSTIARESDGGLYIHAGSEIGVASTKAFTSQLTVIILLTLFLARRREMTPQEGSAIISELETIPGKIKTILEDKTVVEIAKVFKGSKNFIYLGRGIQFPIALEGALKLKEISYIHAEGYPAAEMKHGPIALIDENMPVVFIALKDDIYSKVISNMQEVRARKGKIIAIATEGDTEIYNYADYVIHVPTVHGVLSPLLTVIPLQLLAYHIAVMKGCDVDRPRNLAKSVTVE
ncbi:MAG: glutamine--fructose-6-phosphate transaminase (isomerizing) [Leptospirales bacterium]|nr:glutamine--fructose-6-phosphate transaminase (isomerizing) [Leptospirales bacterium]